MEVTNDKTKDKNKGKLLIIIVIVDRIDERGGH